MSPVHMIIGEDPRAEAMWKEAFAGAVDLYRFDRNVDAFERLTAAQAPVDLAILTPAQHGPFNLTPDQFVARVLEGPLGNSRFLGNLHVIVVGEPLVRSHPRAMAVSTLDAAIRLVKFGELERSVRPEAPKLPVAIPDERRTSNADMDAIVAGSSLSDSVISRIWDAPRAEPSKVERSIQPVRHKPQTEVTGGGATPVGPSVLAHSAAPATSPQLFSRSAAQGFVVASGPMQVAPAVTGGGESAQVGAPGEAIEVATGALQPSRDYQLPNGAGYRGPPLREGHVHGALHVSQPVPPQLASQVQMMVYGNAGAVPDPLLVWSSSSRGQIVAHGVPVPGPAQPSVAAQQPPAAPSVRTVPIDPPAGAYGAVAPQATPSSDPFLRRAEEGGGEVSFG